MPDSAPSLVDPEPVFDLERPRWQARSNCHPQVMPHVWQQFEDCSAPLDLFFPNQKATPARRQAIESVCGPCPVREECFEWGVVHERDGYWGGQSASEVDRERKRRGMPIHTLELDPRNRKTIGTFYEPGHGSVERYARHKKDGEEACELCKSALREDHRQLSSERWAQIKATETPEEREERLDREYERRYGKPRRAL